MFQWERTNVNTWSCAATMPEDSINFLGNQWLYPSLAFVIYEKTSNYRATFPRVRSLRNAAEKMSKSDPSDLSRINLVDSEELIEMKIMKAKTDSIQEVNSENNF